MPYQTSLLFDGKKTFSTLHPVFRYKWEAENYADSRMELWRDVKNWTITETDKGPTHTFVDDKLYSLNEIDASQDFMDQVSGDSNAVSD